MGIFSLALWAALDYLSSDPDSSFDPYGLPDVGWFVLIWLALAWALSRFSRPRADYRSVLLLTSSIAPFAIVTAWLLDSYVSNRWSAVVVWGFVLFATIYLERGLRVITGTVQTIAITVALIATLGFATLNDFLYIRPTLWAAPEINNDSSGATWQQSESLLFDQPARIDAALAKIEPAAAANPAVYFVGFAGMGEQQVFAKEIGLAATTVGKRYTATDRTMFLVNNRRDLNTYPLATVSGLRRTLKGMAAIMDPKEDILFLALSSHGSKDGEISVSNGAVPLQQLTAQDLATTLRESGIKWKVIVVSACYSGTFIEPLHDENTIVLTASAKDRNSFGCSDDRELTYFGEAFFRDALPNAASLREAFEKTKAAIAARERQEKLDASNPQGFFGAALEKKLSEIEADASHL